MQVEITKQKPSELGIVLLVACVVLLFVLPYVTWGEWPPLGSTLGLLVVGWVLGERRVGRSMGLSLSQGSLWRCGALFLLLLIFFFILQGRLLEARGLTVIRSDRSPFLHTNFLALNEEIVLGWLLLLILLRRGAGIHQSAWILALVFAAAHGAFYRLGMYASWLSPWTFCALVAAGVLRHYAIHLAGHIGYAWAIHAAWNICLFNGRVLLDSEGASFEEPELFDAFLGHPALASLTMALALSTTAFVARSGRASRIH